MDSILKFSFIGLCFLISIISFRFCFSKRNWTFLAIGMTFTLISDFFLVLCKNRQIGFFTFCFVHIAYILRVSRKPKKHLIIALIIVICLAPLSLFLDSLIVTAIIYLCLFVQDIIINAYSFKTSVEIPKINRILILSGIILFALCDVNVMLDVLPDYVAMPSWIQNTAHKLIWVFYTPAQFLLAISAINYKKQVNQI